MTATTTATDSVQQDVVIQDVVIIGAGMVGAATAIGLAKLGLAVTVIENQPLAQFDPQQALDVRVSALSLASETLLSRLGAWEHIKAMRTAPYLGLETWEMEGFITRFHASQLQQTHLGHIVENRVVQLGLWQAMAEFDNLSLRLPTKVERFSRNADGIEVVLEDGTVLHTKLLVGADGANSRVRDFAAIGITAWDYDQWAMLINIATETGQQDVTWQQFTPAGPRSLLPLPGKHASLVWYDSPARIRQLSQLSNSALAQQIRTHFPSRLDPEFEVLDKGHFALTRRHAQRYYRPNLVLLGDAAHTINPLAGQGVNLGFKDVEALLAVVSEAQKEGDSWYSDAVLGEYQQRRYRDNQIMMTAMDSFYAGFSNDLLPLKLARNAALRLANIDGPLKRRVLKYALGLG
nr:FAD-dependent oxidoreductase [Shewanella cyperi]